MPSNKATRSAQQRARRARRDSVQLNNERQTRRQQYAERDSVEAANAREARRQQYAERDSVEAANAREARRQQYAERSSVEAANAREARRQQYAESGSIARRQQYAVRGRYTSTVRQRMNCDDQCYSCKRKQITGAEDPYHLRFYKVNSSRIRLRGRFKLNHMVRATGRNACTYNLCEECKMYLVDSNNQTRNVWPLFLYCVLFGWYTSTFFGKSYHYSICGGQTLWRLIPQSARAWWVDEISMVDEYNGCTLNYPTSVFEDRTLDIKRYNEDFNSGQLARVRDAMNNNKVIDNNLLCPWGCSASCRSAGRLSLDIVVQRMIPEVNLILFSNSTELKYRLVQSSSLKYFRADDRYASILLNPEWKVKPTVVIEDGCLQVLTCKWHDGGRDKLVCLAPESPHGHILNSEQADQLAPCVRKHRVTQPMKASKYNTTFQMFEQRSEYKGVSTMDLTQYSDFSNPSELRSQHEAASVIGRSDISLLLQKKVQNRQLSQELADSIIKDAKRRFDDEEQIRTHTHGSTYVRFADMVRIQLFESSVTKNIAFVDDRPTNHETRTVFVKRSWQITNNIMQTEDHEGYGTQFRAIQQFTDVKDGVPTAMTWTLFAMLSSCPELWREVDTKLLPHRWSGWEPWILTSIQATCFKYDTVIKEKALPIKKLTKLKDIVGKVNDHLPLALGNDAPSFYGFNLQRLRLFFPRDDYQSKVEIVPSLDQIYDVNSNVVVVVGNSTPSEGQYETNGSTFDLRVVCVLRSKTQGRNPQDFEAIRYMRHPDFECFWKQERSDCIVTKCNVGSDIYQQLRETQTGDCYFYSCVAVYVRKGCDEVESNWENEFFKSMGGKSHVKCQCRNYPLLATNKSAKKRRACNWKGCIDPNGNYSVHNNCNRKEAFICSNPFCSVRLCRKCYATFSTDSSSTVVPCEIENADDANGSAQSSHDDLNQVSESDEESYSSVNSNQGNMASVMEDFVVSTLQDFTLDLTEDNQQSNIGVPFTDAADIAMNVDERSHTRVSGHVIFNQVGRCLSRKTKQINGNNPQKFWVQSMCSTSAGESTPLLQPEANLFPRHFYAAAKKDPKSILGSRPLFLLSSKKYQYGFDSTLQHARLRMTDPSSSTSTDPKLMCCYYDELGNVTAGSTHTRDIFERGFVVDNSSSSGMAVREKGHTDLSASVDSQKMVRNLARSQKYIKWDWFLTFTLNQTLHPGLAHLSDWKSSQEWTRYIPGYNNMSATEKAEMQRAMEEAAGPHIYSNWHAVMFLLLRHIKDHLSAIGTNMALFGRGEYQESAANVCHWHIITAVDRSTMNEESERYIQDLIRTSVFEVVRTNDDIERLLANGVLKSIDEIPELQQLADTILRHNCDDRCLKRVGDGDGPENFRCRKKHSVNDNPDPASHGYIPFKVKYEQSTLDVLEEIGMYTPPQDPNDPNDHGTFSHGYFTPSSHLAPCNFNADCNMSPIIPDFFVTTKSMQNAQALENTNGLAKYVCKYVAKFDDGNYILLLQDIHTGQWILRKVKLHNTKIAGSKINEDKAFQKSRDKGHPRGREVTYFEIRQLMMGDPEVLTDLTFIPISTLPFELRPTNTIELDDEGKVINPDEDEIDEDGNDNPDFFTEGIPMQRARMQFDLSEWHRMTEGQMLTYRNHNGRASKYDQISKFSLRPPELLGVFRNPIDYFRYCYIDEDDCYNENDAEEALCDDINECPWIDCLGRRVKMYALALNDVLDLVERNLEDYESIDQFDEANEFRILMNLAVKDMIRMYQASESGDQLSDEELEWVEDTIRPNFIHFDETMKNLPIPVASDVRPDNAHQFLTHIILSLGKYDTEIDALSHPNTRECLRAVGLIGNSSDDDQLRQYSNDLTRIYIEEQLVYYAISLTVGETFIVTSKNVMDNAIVNDSLSMNELPPFTMASLRMSTTAQNEQWWTDMKSSQLDSIYSTRSLQQTDGMPTREEINNVTRDTPLMWNPTDVMTRYERQSEESFAEQKYAIGLEVDQINRYRNANQEGNFTYLKNTVIYGAPGTGKSFVSQSLVLYAISQGLNVISTALMGVRANALGGGGLHLHQLFKLPTDDSGTKLSPFKAAQAALGKIYRQIDLLHALLTVDVIFIDECSQVSSETLVMIDIILRKLRGNSQTPFGGVHIIGTMDNSQLQPIEELPFLVSSFMLTCFVMVKLEHSVRAYGDVRFQRLQAISRMDPFDLRASQALKSEFFTLAHDILTFVPDWDDPRIGPNMMRAFSRKNPAKRTLDDFREKIKSQLTAEGVEF